jgi:two-component system response regulator AtoC
LVDINCGGIPENLLESEMFGYVKGAFTDANRTKKGLFEEANGGTLFLDEIGDMPLPLQVKLLRALQEEEIRPLGYGQSIKVDVRIIAATAKKLRDQVRDKQFRDDLFYRINVLAIEVPPLRERQEDIPLLVDYFVKKYNQRLGLAITDIDKACLHKLMHYNWPGNVRELENVIERGMALADGDVLTVKNLPAELFQGGAVAAGLDLANVGFSIKQNRATLERHLIAKALAETGGNRTHSAGLLEISIPALLYKMKEYELS